MKELYYTTHEVSKFCNVYPSTVINWISDGILPAFATPGGHRRVKKSDLISFMKKYNMPIPEELVSDKTRILIVDDDPKILKMIETVLKAEKDLEVSVARDGFSAGVMTIEWGPDIILLDMLMPEIDGFEVCKRIRDSEIAKDTPIIAVTVLKDEKDIKKMQDAGITDHIAKPFKAEELVNKIRKHIKT